MFLHEGHGTLFSFSNYPGLLIRQKEVQLPGEDGGDPIDTTHMELSEFHTKMPPALKDITDGNMVVAYDPQDRETILGMINELQEITGTLPNGDAETFWGWLKSFQPNRNVSGEEPTADCVIVCGNVNEAGEETGPSWSLA